MGVDSSVGLTKICPAPLTERLAYDCPMQVSKIAVWPSKPPQYIFAQFRPPQPGADSVTSSSAGLTRSPRAGVQELGVDLEATSHQLSVAAALVPPPPRRAAVQGRPCAAGVPLPSCHAVLWMLAVLSTEPWCQLVLFAGLRRELAWPACHSLACTSYLRGHMLPPTSSLACQHKNTSAGAAQNAG